ncbi:hypothetical protein EMCRGX_G030865 [Ephydatia muelleri]
MAVEEFQFKLATAKDLPVFWFELVLCPDKFRSHLNTLLINPNVEPTALQLITTFLEKAGLIHGQPVPEGPGISEEKRRTLVECALFMGAFLKWDLGFFEKNLNLGTQYALLSSLVKAHPLNGGSDWAGSGPLALSAQVLFHLWVVRVSLRWSPSATPVPGDTISSATEQILIQTERQVNDAVTFLSSVCDKAPQDMALPTPSLSLPLPNQNGGKAFYTLGPPLGEMHSSGDAVWSQVLFHLGAVHFKCSDYTKAYAAFCRSRQLLQSLSNTPPLIDRTKLNGYLLACLGMLPSEEGEHHLETNSVAQKIERLRLRPSEFEESIGMLEGDTKLSSMSRVIMELQAAAFEKSQDEGPPVKKQKLEEDFLTIPSVTRVCLCNAVWNILEGNKISPRVMQLLSRGERKILDYFVHICKQALLTNQTQQSLNRLQSFVRIMCCSVDMSVDIGGLAVQGLVAAEDEQLLHSHLPGSSVTPPSVDFSVQEECDIIAKVPQLERQLLWATTPQALLSAIDELFKFLAPPEQRAFVQKWSGFGKGYASQENIPDPILLVKYNALVRRSTFLRTAKVTPPPTLCFGMMSVQQLYATSLEFLHEALKLLTTKCSPYVKPQLEPGLQEQKFTIELLTAISQKDKAVGSLSAQQQQLADKAQIYYKESQTDGSMDPVSISVVGAFLLNARRYSFLASCEPFIPGKVPPRLAAVVLSQQDDKDMRKPTRDFFEAVLSVFAPPVGNAENKADKQSKFRSYLDILIENMTDPHSISFLLAGVARIWNMLAKPEDEIVTEYVTHWPTAIGNPESIESDHVLRALSSTLRRALQLQPTRPSWLLLQADLFNATGKHGAALGHYLESGVVPSRYFEDDVPAEIWSQQVYRRIINCCSHLSYYTHVVILCQFLKPVDYELAFATLRNHSSSTTESLYIHLWDMTIIEYIIYIHSKNKDALKQMAAVAGQPELNFNNSTEALTRAVQVRRRQFLRTFYQSIVFHN